MAPLTDEQLVKKCKRGFQKRKHWDVLILRYDKYVKEIARKRLSDPEPVKDIVQDTFFKAFKGLGSFRGDCSFKTWLSVIAVRLCSSYQRDAARNRERFPFSFEDEKVKTDKIFTEKREKDTLKQLLNKEEKMMVRSALKELSKAHRETITLWSEGFSYEEIAELMGTSTKTVGSRIYYAKIKIREMLVRKGFF